MRSSVSQKIPSLAVCVVALASGHTAWAETYQKCYVANPDYNQFCTPASANPPVDTTASSESITLSSGTGSTSTVLVVPGKNCRPRSERIRGNITIVVDNSASTIETDPSKKRNEAATTLLNDIRQNAQEQLNAGLITTANPDFPRVAIEVYGGRQGINVQASNGGTQYDADGLNPTFEASNPLCSDADSSSFLYPDKRQLFWENQVGGRLTSVCQFLRLVNATAAGSAATPSLARHEDFVNYSISNPAAGPRGATDLRYFYDGVKQSNMPAAGQLGATAKAHNAIIVTDGLPNISKRIASNVCKQKNYLKDKEISPADPSAPLSTQPYCLDNQFRLAAKLADDYLVDTSEFRTINNYNVLFIGDEKTKIFVDVDDEGELNPGDFLIENSARTGNGKVKFKLARGADELKNYTKGLFDNFSDHSLQRIQIKVNNGQPYNAVSNSDMDKPTFTMKFVGLNNNSNNTVEVKYFYGDHTVTKNYNVNVTGSASGITAPYACENKTDATTVDGDDPNEKKPKGDGVLFKPDSSGRATRVYRNEDPGNDLPPEVFVRSTASQTNARVLSNAEKLDEGKLRIQGGTGNCGVVALKGEKSNVNYTSFLLFLAPLLGAVLTFARGRGKQ